MADYEDLYTRILDELDRTDLTAQVQLEIKSAIKHYEKERWWWNEDQTATVTTPGTATLALPADFLELDTLHIERNGHPEAPLSRETWGWYRGIGADDPNIGNSAPSAVVIYADQFYLYPIPDATYTAVVSYLVQEATLSATADSNHWTNEAEDLIRQRAKAAFKINYEGDASAKQEAAGLAMRNEQFLSVFERTVYNGLKRLTVKRVASGRVVAARF